jgi:hypothetical protein
MCEIIQSLKNNGKFYELCIKNETSVRSNHNVITSCSGKYKIRVSRSSFRKEFFMKIMTADGREATIGRSTYQQN